jgi:hypothetical protein
MPLWDLNCFLYEMPLLGIAFILVKSVSLQINEIELTITSSKMIHFKAP